LLFVLYWETMRFFENRRAAAMSEAEDSWLDSGLRVYGMVWTGASYCRRSCPVLSSCSISWPE